MRRRSGDFEQWFIRALGPERFRYQTVDVFRGDPLPDINHLDRYSGIIVTGSPAMVSDRHDWSEKTAAWLRPIVDEEKLPVLGVCYGHQLIAHAVGARVGPNPAGRRMGTRRLTAQVSDDPLLGPLAPEANVHVTHLEVVLDLPPETRVLGYTEGDRYHALRFGARSWGVQFHPEFDEAIMRCYVEARASLLDAEGLDSRAILDSVSPCPAGRQVLDRFAALCEAGG